MLAEGERQRCYDDRTPIDRENDHVRSKPTPGGPDPGSFLMNPLIRKLRTYIDLPHMIKSGLVQKLAEQNSHLYPRDIDTIVNAIFGTIGHALAIRMACESVRCSQELLAASRSNQYRHEHLWQAQPDGEPRS